MVALTRDLTYGIHSVCLLDRENGFVPFKDGLFDIVGGATINTSKELVNLMGGSNPAPFDSEEGATSSELTFMVRQYNQAIYRAGLGAVVNLINASATGTISTLVNAKGTLVAAATKIASVSILSSSEANLKFGKYIVKAITATTVNIYGTTDVDNLRGTDIEFQDDEMKLLASNLTITTGGNTDVASLGIRLTGGTGTIALVAGDTAIFNVIPPHGGIREYSVGTQGSTNPYVGVLVISQKKSDGEIDMYFMPKVKLSGFNISLTEKAFNDVELTGTIIRAVNPFNTAEEITMKQLHRKGA